MKFTAVKEPIPFLIIDDTYTVEEQSLIYKELNFLSNKLKGPEDTGSACNDGKLKNNKGLFLDTFFTDRGSSDILKVNRKLFTNQVKSELSSVHYAYNLFRYTNHDTTLLSYYENGGNYFSHYDGATITVLSWFFKEPRNFQGGNLKFSDYNISVEVKNNRSVIFFSSYIHEVETVQLIEKNIPLSGRFTISQFCKIL